MFNKERIEYLESMVKRLEKTILQMQESADYQSAQYYELKTRLSDYFTNPTKHDALINEYARYTKGSIRYNPVTDSFRAIGFSLDKEGIQKRINDAIIRIHIDECEEKARIERTKAARKKK
jgi:hypothetical protein